jgi:hypothetical protein
MTPVATPHADGALLNGEDESPPPGGSAGAERHAPAPPSAAVRLRQSTSRQLLGRRGSFLEARAPNANAHAWTPRADPVVLTGGDRRGYRARRQQRLKLRPLPHGHGAFRGVSLTVLN